MLKPVRLIKHPTATTTQVPGLFIAALATLLAYVISQWQPLINHGIGLLSTSMLVGLCLAPTLPKAAHQPIESGLLWCKYTALRIGIALYGLRLSLQQVTDIGAAAIAIDCIIIMSVMFSCVLLARYILKMDMRAALIIGTGHAVCGAAAILASNSVIRAKDSQVTIAVACIVLLGTASMLFYPWLYHQLALDSKAFGIFTGATVHEVAQVAAIGNSLNQEVMEAALITKLTRVLLLAPLIIILQACLSRYFAEKEHTVAESKLPVFIIGFVCFLLLNTFFPLPEQLQRGALHLGEFLMALAMAALGLSTRISTLKQAGFKPLLLALLLTILLVILGLLLSFFTL